MSEEMYEIFAKPLSTKHLYEKFEYVLNHEMTQELFNLCCLHHIDKGLLSNFKDCKSRCKKIQNLHHDYNNKDCIKKLDYYYTIIQGETVYMTDNLNKKVSEYTQWNDINLMDITIEDVYKLMDENDFICRGLNHDVQYELFNKIVKFLITTQL